MDLINQDEIDLVNEMRARGCTEMQILVELLARRKLPKREQRNDAFERAVQRRKRRLGRPYFESW